MAESRLRKEDGRQAGRRLDERVGALLREADIRIDGNRPQDIRVHHPDFYRRVLAEGSLGLGESYMDAWWDCDALDDFFAAILGHQLDRRVITRFDLWDYLRARLFNLQRGRRSYRVGEHHYDLGNDFYRRMLDRRMIYSCGYWPAETLVSGEISDAGLDQAQVRKLELCARKLKLEPGMRVLDIGCGWGGAARYLAEQHGVEVVGITISKRQAEYAREHCAGLPVEIRLEDYRDTRGQFDRLLSIGMFEHVGHKNYHRYMETAARLLRPDGLFLLHTIGANRRQYRTDPWIARYIFPNSMAPYAGNIGRTVANRFVVEDWQNIGVNYDPTLRAWHARVTAQRTAIAEENGFDERFFRMWRYYLLSCAGAFRVRRNQVWQIVLSPRGWPGGYERPDLSGI